MQDPALALIAICGFSVICIGLIVIVGLLVLRFTGRSLGGFLGEGGITGALNSLSGANDPDDDDPISNRRRRPAGSNLRAQAQSLDFDAAVAKHKNQPPRPSSPITNSPFPPVQPAADDSTEVDVANAQERKRRRRLRQDAEEGDDLFEPFMGDDDDIF